jgi:hypothetical protein
MQRVVFVPLAGLSRAVLWVGGLGQEIAPADCGRASAAEAPSAAPAGQARPAADPSRGVRVDGGDERGVQAGMVLRGSAWGRDVRQAAGRQPPLQLQLNLHAPGFRLALIGFTVPNTSHIHACGLRTRVGTSVL